MRPGDLFNAENQGAAGYQQQDKRPYLILQNDRAAALSPLVVAVPLTTQPRVARFPGVVRVEPGQENGLERVSFIQVYQICALDRRWLYDRRGAVPAEVLTQVYAALDRLTGRPALPPPPASP